MLRLPNNQSFGFKQANTRTQVQTFDYRFNGQGAIPLVWPKQDEDDTLLYRVRAFYQILGAPETVSDNFSTPAPYGWWGYVLPMWFNEPHKPYRMDFRSGYLFDYVNESAELANWLWNLYVSLESDTVKRNCTGEAWMVSRGLNANELLYKGSTAWDVWIRLDVYYTSIYVGDDEAARCQKKPRDNPKPDRGNKSTPNNGSGQVPAGLGRSGPYDDDDDFTPENGEGVCWRCEVEGLSSTAQNPQFFTDFVWSPTGARPQTRLEASNPYTGNEPWDRIILEGANACNTGGNCNIGGKPGSVSITRTNRAACGM